jgi:hypothetical protein
MARRIGWAEPYIEAWWMAPISVKDASPFDDPGFGARSTMPQQEGGARFGFEGYAVDQGDEGARLTLELSARMQAHFEGRNYTEMWEVFALAGDASGTGPMILDADPITAGIQATTPGVTNVENHPRWHCFAARISVGQKFRPAPPRAHRRERARDHFHRRRHDLPEGDGAANDSCEVIDDA